MARDRGPPVLWQSPASPRLPAAALPAEARGWGWLGAGLWPALVVGLLAALVAWFWYGGSDGEGEESGEAAPAVQQARGEAEATGSGLGTARAHPWGLVLTMLLKLCLF